MPLVPEGFWGIFLGSNDIGQNPAQIFSLHFGQFPRATLYLTSPTY
jgi:hypothetical protein